MLTTTKVVSGGHFRATRHRVVDPPEDQLKEERLSIVLFQASEGDLRMEPAYGEAPALALVVLSDRRANAFESESPLLKREGCIDSQGAYREFKKLREKGMAVSQSRIPGTTTHRLIHASRSLPTGNGVRSRSPTRTTPRTRLQTTPSFTSTGRSISSASTWG
jgi:hypothetical protein